MTDQDAMRPLSGVRVVEFTSTVLGPYCGVLLAQLGADVVKVEPVHGDLLRATGVGGDEGMSGYFLQLNLGKRSLSISPGSDSGKEVVRRLIEWSDVIVHNMSRPAARRLGLKYESVHEINPRAILAAAHGFSVRSPHPDAPAYDDIIQAGSGFAFVEGLTNGGEPRYAVSAIADRMSGLMLVIGVQSALLQRERTGRGACVEVPMREVMVNSTLVEHLQGESFVPAKGPSIYPRTASPFRKPYRTSDGYVAATFYTDAHWQRFFEIADRPDLAVDPRFAGVGQRVIHIDELYAEVAKEIVQRSTEYWLHTLEAEGCPVAQVDSIHDLLADASLTEGGVIEVLDHPTAGKVRTITAPIEFEGAPLPNAGIRPAPLLGEHTSEILREIGMPEEAIAMALRSGDARQG